MSFAGGNLSDPPRFFASPLLFTDRSPILPERCLALSRSTQLQQSRALYPRGWFPLLSQPAWPEWRPRLESSSSRSWLAGSARGRSCPGKRWLGGPESEAPTWSSRRVPGAEPPQAAGVAWPLGSACSHFLANSFLTLGLDSQVGKPRAVFPTPKSVSDDYCPLLDFTYTCGPGGTKYLEPGSQPPKPKGSHHANNQLGSHQGSSILLTRRVFFWGNILGRRGTFGL